VNALAFRRALRHALAVVGGAALAAAMLLYLHQERHLLWAVACGGFAAAARALAATTWAPLPPFVRRVLDTGAVVCGAALASASTLAMYPWSYLALRWQAASGVLAVAAVAGVATAALAWSHNAVHLRVTAQEARLAATRREALEARHRALQAQINPHFLFNALNTLADVVHDDADLAEQLVQDLAEMMRYALRSSSGAVPLRQEIQMVQRYLHFEQERLGARLRSEITVDADVEEVRVPGLLVQPLVENAIRHAIAPRIEGGRLEVVARRRGDRLEITVDDDGPGVPDALAARLREATPPPQGTGTGGAGGAIENVRARARLHGGAAGVLSVERSALGGARFVLTVPLDTGESP
jgi:signal transduction histidine kinase